MKKGIWGLVCLLAAALMLPVDALAQGTSPGWNDDGTVYTVVGKDGWWDTEDKQIVLDHDCTVDLSQADTPDESRYNFYAPFKITGENTEVTFVTGNRQAPLSLGNLALFYVA